MARRHQSYEGEGITVTYDARRCIHAGVCVRGLPGVFKPRERPWVQLEGTAVDAVVETIRRCPTGALQARWKDRSTTDAAAEPVEDNRIALVPDGPLYARGDLRVVTAAGEEIVRDTRVALCRCGASKIKPFCDGSHREAGFADPGALAEPQLRGDGEGAGEVTFTVAQDGPLVVRGPVAMEGADGSSCAGSQGALCRCGASRAKPFCDGSHGPAGFSDG